MRIHGAAVVVLFAFASCGDKTGAEGDSVHATKRDALLDIEISGRSLSASAISTVPLSSRFVMIPRSAWDRALTTLPGGTPRPEGLGFYQASNEVRKAAAFAAEIGNDPTASGVIGFGLMAPGVFTSQDVLVVVDNPGFDPQSLDLLTATDYFIAAAGLDGFSEWMVRDVGIAIEPISSGGGRCCGPETVGEQKTPIGPWPGVTPPGCSTTPQSMCDWGAQIRTSGQVGNDAHRTAIGRTPISMVMFATSGELMQFSFAGPRGGIAMAGFGCGVVQPVCLDDPPTPELFGGWEAELPHGNPNCAPSTTVSGVNVPPVCTIAGTTSLGAVGGSVVVVRNAGVGPSMCDGQCTDCSSLAGFTNTDVIPRQCWVRNLPGDICEKDAWSEVEAYQNDVNARFDYNIMTPCGDPQDLTARCGACQPVPGGKFQECGRCTKANNVVTCQWQMLPTADPRAEGSNYYGVALGVAEKIAESGSTGSELGEVIKSPSPPPTLTTVTLLPQPPCTAGCNQTGRTADYPSRAPLPGGAAQVAEAGGPGGGGGGGAGGGGGGSAAGGGSATGGGAGSGGGVPNSNDPPGAGDGAKKTVAKNAEAKGDPVSLFDGSLLLNTSDLSFPGPVRPLAFTRSYSSRSSARGTLGSNWSHNFEVRLVPLKKQNLPAWVDPYCMGTPHVTTCVMLVNGDSSRIFYLDQATGLFMPQAGSMATIRQTIGDPNGSTADEIGWVLRHPDGAQLQFDRYGYLTADVDRFGNGLTLTYENTPAGVVAEQVCPEVPYLLGPGGYSPVIGPTGISSAMQGCVLLYGLTGLTSMPSYSDDLVVTDAMFGTTDGGIAVTAARAAVVASQPRFGTPLAAGHAFRRLLSVKDNLGRELSFDYFTSGPNTGLLESVRGPIGSGAKIEFSYSQDPASPAGLNERFLTRAKRVDDAPGSGLLVAAGQRGYEYEYAWQATGRMPTDLAAAGTAFRNYFSNVYNCGTLSKAPCSDDWVSTVQFANLDLLVAEQTRRLYSEAADNILTVRVFDYAAAASHVESETRYAQNVYDQSFDRAIAQRWGAVADPALPTANLPSSTTTWLTNLPLALFEYQGAEPVVSNANTLTGDRTTAFLPPELSARYPLETEVFNANHPAGEPGPIQTAYDKGYLLPRNSPDALPFGTRPHAVRGAEQFTYIRTRPACGIENLTKFRTYLPNYAPSLDYYDVALPTADLATEGVSFSQQLRRSHVSCETLALSETYDVTHNDLASTWNKALDGGFVVETMTGRRKHTAANANRICEWVKYTDRDGDAHFTGLNFQGRPLVEAVRTSSQWKVAETLYNADGNVVSQRRTTDAVRQWAPNDGDTRYTYQEEAIAAGSLGTTRPRHWEKRGNVVRVWERPRGTSIWDEVEGTDTQVESRGRFTAFAYEPFFNQVRLVVRGNVKADGTDEPLERTVSLFDYQEHEASSPEIQALLQYAKLWGAPFPVDANRRIDWNAVSADLFVQLFNEDLNGDGTRQGQIGVPIALWTMDAARTQQEGTFLRWSPSGRPYMVEEPGGGATILRYYSIGGPQTGLADLTPTGSASGGNYGFLASVIRSREWPASAGPARTSCSSLPSHYRFLLTSCGTDLSSALGALGLSSEAIDGIVKAPAATTTSFNYNILGHVSGQRSATGARTLTTMDVDGRTTRTELYAPGSSTPHQATEFVRDGFKRVTRERHLAGNGTSLGDVVRTFDNDDRVLTECHESKIGGCDAGRTEHVKQAWVYTREGNVFRTIDGMGLVAQYDRDGRKWVTKERLISPDPADPVRQTQTWFDDDGRVTSRRYGVQTPLRESFSWDGLGRLLSSADTQERTREFRYTKRDATSSELLVGDTAGKTCFLYDALGRTRAVTKNGTGLAEYDRLPGGLVYAQSATGRGRRFVTYDANGRPAWTENSVGDQAVLTELVSPAHLVTQSRIRQGGLKTTTTVALLNVLGLPEWTMEQGGSLKRTTTFARDVAGNITSTEAPDSSVTEADYDLLGRVVELREQKTWGTSAYEISQYTYNARGQLDTVTDPAKYVTVQTYDGFGAPQAKTIPASTPIVSRWEYDDLGRKTRHLVNQHVDMGFEYNALGQLSAIVKGKPYSGAAPIVSYEWDALGRLSLAKRTNLGAASVLSDVDRMVKTTRTYDDLNRIFTENTQVGQQPARTVTSQWSFAGQWLREVTLPSGRRQVHRFDDEGRESAVERVTGQRTKFDWVDELLGEQRSEGQVDTLNRTISFDELAQPVAWKHTLGARSVMQVDVVRDVAGRIGSSAISFFPNGTQIDSWRGYTYEATGRLSAVHESSKIPGLTITAHSSTQAMEQEVLAAGASISATHWAYEREDVVGSVLKISDGIHTPRFETAPLHQTPGGTATARLPGYQLDKFNVGNAGRQASHDSSGRLVSDGDQGYVFDDLDALALVNDRKGKWREAYLYDAAGRLAARAGPTGELETLVSDGQQFVEAFDEKGAVRWAATWGPGIDNLVSMTTSHDEFFSLDDGKANVVGWVGSQTGELEAYAEYTPEGRAKFTLRGSGFCEEVNGVRCARPLGLPFGFHSAYASAVTGLQYFRNRWYSPESGLWLSRDPMGVVDSFNEFAFNAFDPINGWDPLGLSSGSVSGEPRPKKEIEQCMSYGLSALDCGGENIVVTGPSDEEERELRMDFLVMRIVDNPPLPGPKPSPSKPNPRKPNPPRPSLTSLPPGQAKTAIEAMTDEELQSVAARIENPLKMDLARARELRDALDKRLEKELPVESVRWSYVNEHLLEGYFRVNDAQVEEGLETTTVTTATFVQGMVGGQLGGTIAGGVAGGLKKVPERVVFPRGAGAATGPVPRGHVPVSRWVDQAEAKLWIGNGGTHIPGGIGAGGRVYVTVPGAARPGGTGPIRIDFTVDSAALNAAGKEGWFQIFQPVQNMPIYNVSITCPAGM